MTIGTVTIDKIKFPIELRYKKSQSIGISTSGMVSASSSGLEELFIKLKLDKKDRTSANNLKNFIRTTANYTLNSFLITPDQGIDLGAGNGIARTVRYWKDNIDIKIESNDIYDFEFIFRVEN